MIAASALPDLNALDKNAFAAMMQNKDKIK
jgi:hypothetical protein